MTETVIKNNKVFTKLVKSTIFIVIFCIMWNYCFSVLWLEKNSITFFYEEPKNSLDVVYIGSSNAYAHFNSVLAYNQYGFATGILSTDSQPFAAVKYLIEETKKYQTPKIYVIDILKLVEDIDIFTDAHIRNNIDAMKFTKNRIEAINELLSYTNIDKTEYINYYFSFLLYHNKWKNVNKLSFEVLHLYKGYLLSNKTVEILQQNAYHWVEDIRKLPEENKHILLDLIKYIKNNNLKVLFVIPIRSFSHKLNGRLNDATNILEENNLEVINFNTLDDFEVDFSTDLYNEAHLNVYGATKYTLYFANYLKEHYNLIDHRNDNKYELWENEYERFKEDFKKLTDKDFNDILLEY